MRGLEREYDAISRREPGCSAAWLPRMARGDIGDDGVGLRGIFQWIWECGQRLRGRAGDLEREPCAAQGQDDDLSDTNGWAR